MLGKSENLLNADPGFEYVQPVTYAELVRIITENETYNSYQEESKTRTLAVSFQEPETVPKSTQ